MAEQYMKDLYDACVNAMDENTEKPDPFINYRRIKEESINTILNRCHEDLVKVLTHYHRNALRNNDDINSDEILFPSTVNEHMVNSAHSDVLEMQYKRLGIKYTEHRKAPSGVVASLGYVKPRANRKKASKKISIESIEEQDIERDDAIMLLSHVLDLDIANSDINAEEIEGYIDTLKVFHNTAASTRAQNKRFAFGYVDDSKKVKKYYVVGVYDVQDDVGYATRSEDMQLGNEDPSFHEIEAYRYATRTLSMRVDENLLGGLYELKEELVKRHDAQSKKKRKKKIVKSEDEQ